MVEIVSIGLEKKMRGDGSEESFVMCMISLLVCLKNRQTSGDSPHITVVRINASLLNKPVIEIITSLGPSTLEPSLVV